ncbi:MAG: dCTP deaminase [Candidatus Yonathbacteria bacterium]|nr:dCTP deaminase [Candidatus Yonathbacteria bacterium]NTW47774.1 dCTP deaminase [Candidatus Yonathbacteria bacterium]
MILSDRDIKQAILDGDIYIDPYNDHMLQPASVDLSLGKHFLVYDRNKSAIIDTKKPVEGLMREVSIEEDEPFILHPGEFALGMIYEKTGVSDAMVGRLEGKSSVGRLGLMIHVTAGFLDPGNTVNMTLDLFNTASLPMLLYYRMPIAQMVFERVSSSSERPYDATHAEALGSKYVGSGGKPVASQMWKNFDEKHESKGQK